MTKIVLFSKQKNSGILNSQHHCDTSSIVSNGRSKQYFFCLHSRECYFLFNIYPLKVTFATAEFSTFSVIAYKLEALPKQASFNSHTMWVGDIKCSGVPETCTRSIFYSFPPPPKKIVKKT